MLGNGFDLYHRLFTGYKEYICVCNYLIQKSFYNLEDLSVYDILSGAFKNQKDKLEKMSCYQTAYKNTKISGKDLSDLTDLSSNNCWLRYLSKQCSSERWVSLEKTISDVLNYIENKNTESLFECFSPLCDELKDSRIIKHTFKYWIEGEKGTEKIYDDFENLILSLKLYLKIFVDNVLDNIPKLDESINPHFWNMDSVISFNYTHTYEKLYDSRTKVVHIHGNTENDVIVGINPDKNDTKGNANPKYIAFKKYYHRITKNTISDLSDLFYHIKNDNHKHQLLCVGHSLDVTDSDIITTLFDLFNEVIVYYHNNASLDKYIKNLTQIYGAEDFNKMLLSSRLIFEKLPDNEYALQKPVVAF